MRIVVLWGLFALLCQQALVSSHILGRPSSMNDMAQLKSLLDRFEETLAEAVQEEGDYAATNQESERSPVGRGWGPEQERDQDALILDRSQPAAEDQSQASALSQRNRLLDLLMTARKRTSGCFGARMDRIGNASGLGCNNGRG